MKKGEGYRIKQPMQWESCVGFFVDEEENQLMMATDGYEQEDAANHYEYF